jgi:Nitrile hydratase, alpha chain
MFPLSLTPRSGRRTVAETVDQRGGSVSQHFEPESDERLRARLTVKAWRDPEYRRALLENPKETVAKELGVRELPEELEVRVIEEPPHGLYMVLPAVPQDFDPRELGDSELDDAMFEVLQRRKPTSGWYCH